MLFDALTEREIEIVRLIADGLSNREIGRRLNVTTETVKWYNKRIFAKLDVRSRTQAVARARESGLLQESAAPPPPAWRSKMAGFDR